MRISRSSIDPMLPRANRVSVAANSTSAPRSLLVPSESPVCRFDARAGRSVGTTDDEPDEVGEQPRRWSEQSGYSAM
jgi:hypothetical protein